MILSFRSSSRLVSTSAFAIAALSLLSCGGSGVGEQDGWAPNSPQGYIVRINTATGTTDGKNPGVIQLSYTGENQATIYASSIMAQPFNVSSLTNYIKTGKNEFTSAFDYKLNPSTPTTVTSSFQATCILSSFDDKTKYIRGTASWSCTGFSIPGGLSNVEKGSGTNAAVEMSVSSGDTN